MMSNMRRVMRGDAGAALVAAIAVSFIGFVLATLALTRAIQVARNSGKDTVRTAEVHSAEAALDSALFELESGNPCPGPSFSPVVIGTGSQAVNVDITISYSDADGNAMTDCGVDGFIVGTPTLATVSAVATSVAAEFGVESKRTFEAQAVLIPRVTVNVGAAIFSGAAVTGGTKFTLSPSSTGPKGDIWIDSGDFTCTAGVAIDGNLYVVDGSITFGDKDCKVTGNAWAQYGFSSQAIPSGTAIVGDDITVRQGNMTVQKSGTIVGGDVKLSGTLVQQGSGSLTSASLTENVSDIPNLAPVGLPEIDYYVSEWTSTGFTSKDKTAWGVDVGAAALANGTTVAKVNAFKTNPCSLTKQNLGTAVLKLSATKSVYDLRTCNLTTGTSISLALRADTALFVQSFDSASLTVTSADAAPHTLYIIVPDGGTQNNDIAEGTCRGSYCPGNINFANGTAFTPPAQVFLYTPKKITFYNNMSTYGQIYGGTVDVHPNATFVYTPATIPGVNLTFTPEVTGSSVEVVYKHET